MEQVQLTSGILRHADQDRYVVISQTHGLTGLAYLELTGGSQQSATLQKQEGEEYPVIKTEPSLMRRLDSSVTGLLNNLNRAAENLNAVLDEKNRNVLKKDPVRPANCGAYPGRTRAGHRQLAARCGTHTE